MHSLRDNHARGRQAIGIYQVRALLFVLLLLLNGWLVVAAPSEQELPADDWRQLLLLGYYLATFLSIVLHFVALGLLIRWLRRAYWNLQKLGRPMATSDGWAAGAWFIPFMNLVRPYTIVREVWCQTQLAAYQQVRPYKLLRYWWVVFLLQLFTASIASQLLPDGDGSAAQLYDAGWAGLLNSVLGLATTLLTARVVQRISVDENQLTLLWQVAAPGRTVPPPAAELRGEPDDY